MSPLVKTILLATLAALVAAGVRFGITSARANEAERGLADLSSRLDELGPVVAAVEEFRQARHTVEMKTEVVRELRNQPSIPGTLLGQLLAAPPSGVTVEEVTARGSTLEVSGWAESLDGVGRWLQELQSRDGLEGLGLESFEVPRRGKRKGGRFTFSGSLPVRAGGSDPSEAGA